MTTCFDREGSALGFRRQSLSIPSTSARWCTDPCESRPLHLPEHRFQNIKFFYSIVPKVVSSRVYGGGLSRPAGTRGRLFNIPANDLYARWIFVLPSAIIFERESHLKNC